MRKNIQRCFLLMLVLGLSAEVWAQQGALTAGARGAGLAGAGLNFEDANAALSNQAGTAFAETLAFTAFGEQRFLVPGLNSLGFAGIYPLEKIGTMGLTFNYFGYSAYSEQKVGFLYARKLAKNFSLGIKFDYLATRITDYGMAHRFTGEVGFLYKLNEQLSLAAHVHNPFRVKLPNGEGLATIFRAGLAYRPSKQVGVLAELEKDMRYALSGKIALEYSPVTALALRAGFATAPFRASFGVGLRWSNFVLDFASGYHQVLGFSPAVSFGYALSKANKL